MDPERWEHGSEFAYPEAAEASDPPLMPTGASYWHSGRHALAALVRTLKPKRVLFPSFYCQDVLEACGEATPLAYRDDPFEPTVAVGDVRDGDLVVLCNTFGLRPPPPTLPEAVVVEDHTHDPGSAWARSSKAHYAFASLRKYLPLPDGGVLWSPAGRDVPLAPAHDGDLASVTLDRLTGMLLKQLWLAGGRVQKEAYRAAYVAGESRIGRGEPGPMSAVARALLDTFPLDRWRETRRENHAAFSRALGTLPRVKLVTDRAPRTPFAAVLLFDRAGDRDAVRAALIERRIYPAVLWPIDAGRVSGVPDEHVALSKRLLCLHCDHRYGPRELERVALAVREVMP